MCRNEPKERASYYLVKEIPLFLYYHFFYRKRKRGKLAQGFHNWVREETPPVLIVLACMALYHALKEWKRNGGTPPTKVEDDEDNTKKRPRWEYYFNRENDGGKCFLVLAVGRVVNQGQRYMHNS